jgi:hypothetical protein
MDILLTEKSWDNSVSIVSDYRMTGVQSLADARILPVASVFRPDLRPTQPSIQSVPGIVLPVVSVARV